MKLHDDYICDDTVVDCKEVLKGMTLQEIESEFQKLYGKYLNKDGTIKKQEK